MYVCVKCGRLFTDEDVPTYKNKHTELEGNWYETFIDDCPCGGTLEEAKKCIVCGEYHCEDDFIEEVCLFCLNHHKTAANIEAYVNEFETEKCSFEINAAFEYIFSSEEVNEILMQVFKEYLYLKKILPSRFEDAINTYLQDDWAAYLAERSRING